MVWVVPTKTFLCPISGRLLMDPVLTSDGHTYEKEEIETWFPPELDHLP